MYVWIDGWMIWLTVINKQMQIYFSNWQQYSELLFLLPSFKMQLKTQCRDTCKRLKDYKL